MAAPKLTPALREAYRRLFDLARVRARHVDAVERWCDRVLAVQARYQSIGAPPGIPWYFRAVRETSVRSDQQLGREPSRLTQTNRSALGVHRRSKAKSGDLRNFHARHCNPFGFSWRAARYGFLSINGNMGLIFALQDFRGHTPLPNRTSGALS